MPSGHCGILIAEGREVRVAPLEFVSQLVCPVLSRIGTGLSPRHALLHMLLPVLKLKVAGLGCRPQCFTARPRFTQPDIFLPKRGEFDLLLLSAAQMRSYAATGLLTRAPNGSLLDAD